MNRIFNVIWSTTREKWVVVSEKVKSNGGVPKSSLLSIALLTSLLATGVPAYAIDSGALPAGGQITAGAGSIGSSGSRMTVNQGSQQMIANWSSFNIGTDASVQFIQPNVSATVLNRIADQNPSQILGSLSANGKVFLLNQSGIIFGKNARVDVGGLVASSLNMLDSDFLAAKYKFFTSGNAGKILNQGSIIVAPGGVVALIAPKVTNEGAITAKSGSAALGAGNKVSVDFTGDGLITLTVDQGVIDALVENKGLVKADGGLVVMTASAADALSQSTVNNSGIIEANTLQQQGGRILLDAVGGMTTVSGTLDASSADGKGGQVVATGDRVLVTDGAHLTASGATGGGEVLVGGNWQGKDTAIHQATGTIVEPGALLEANATDTGNGGTVVAWSDVTNPLSVTRAYGTFEAMGGPHGGDGGRIETSGHWLDVAGSQGGASAAHGQGGLWLFDPYDVTISDTFFVDLPADSWSIGNPGDPLFWIPVLGSNISVYSILGKLSGGTHVTVETSGSVSAGGEPGIIDVRTDIILASTSPLTATLTLKADSSIQLHNFTIGCIDSARLNLELVTLGTVSGTGNIGGWGDTIFNIGGNSIYDGTISDGSSLNGGLVVRTLTKEGTGTLTLTAKNNFTGTTTINAGAIMVSGTNAALGDTSGGGAAITVVSGAALELDNVSIDNNLDLQGTLSSVSGDNTYGGYISLFGLPTINADSGTTLTVDFAVYGFGDLSVSGQGTVVFNGEIGNSDSSLSSFTGATETTLEIYGGLVETVGPQTFNGPTTFGNVGGTKLITSIGGITAHGQVTSTAALTLNAGTGDIAFDNSSNDFSTLEVTSAGDITLIDKNALTLSGILATGTVYVETLTDDLTVDGDINNGNFSIGNDVFVTLRANQNIILKQSITNTSSFKLNLEFKAVNGGVWGTGNIIGDGATIFNVGGKGIYDGTISNGVSTNGFIVRTFTKDGSGEQTLLGSNTYTGDTTVSTGTLILGASDVIPNLSNLVVDGSGVFDIGTYNDTVSTVTLNGTGSIIGSGGKLASSSYTIDSNGDTSISAILSDFAVGTSSTLDKYKTGTLTLSGANTYTGVTTINGGTISIAADSGLGAVPTAPVTGQLVLDNGTLETTGSFTLSSNRGIYLTMGSGTFSTADGTTLACDGIIAGSGGLTKIGAGTLTLSGLNTYDGVTTIKNGALNITNAGALGSTSGNTIVELDAALELYSSTALTIAAELLSLSGTGISGGGALRNRAGTNNYSGNITLTANSSINSDPGTGILTVGAIDGPYNLVINSAAGVTLTGKVGNITPLVSLSTFLGTKLYLNGSLVTTTGTQTYNDAVTLGGDTSLSGTTVTFNGTVDGGTYSLYIAGNAVFGDASVDTVTGLNMLHVSGTTLINSSTVSSSGVQTYNDGVTLGSDVTLTSTGVGSLGDITFDWTLDGGHSLAVNTAGATTFGGIIGGTAPLTSLTTNATGTTAINGSSVTTAVAQTYNDAVTFGGDTSLIGPTITFNGIVAGGTYSLDITGNAVFGDASGDIVTGLNMLQVSGTTLIKSSAVSSFGVQRYNGGVTLGSDVTLTSTGVGSLGDITFDSTLDGGQSLTVNTAGATTFGGIIGGTAP
ncbi:MAG: autotransporter-associated beta strand repeat-containing protein, partial [Chlorobiaceae bacterium]